MEARSTEESTQNLIVIKPSNDPPMPGEYWPSLPVSPERGHSPGDNRAMSPESADMSRGPESAYCGPEATQEGSPRVCQVCGMEASGRFFGAMVCLPCKTFYIRCTTDATAGFRCSAQQRCQIQGAANRSTCKACRFQRCLDVGMQRKERPEVVKAEAGQQLCEVCKDIANGIHFGVISCEGCKKFFRRGMKEKTPYVCRSNQRCVINPRTRNACRACRMAKCKAVGMNQPVLRSRHYANNINNNSKRPRLDESSNSSTDSEDCLLVDVTPPSDYQHKRPTPMTSPLPEVTSVKSEVPSAHNSPISAEKYDVEKWKQQAMTSPKTEVITSSPRAQHTQQQHQQQQQQMMMHHQQQQQAMVQQQQQQQQQLRQQQQQALQTPQQQFILQQQLMFHGKQPQFYQLQPAHHQQQQHHPQQQQQQLAQRHAVQPRVPYDIPRQQQQHQQQQQQQQVSPHTLPQKHQQQQLAPQKPQTPVSPPGRALLPPGYDVMKAGQQNVVLLQAQFAHMKRVDEQVQYDAIRGYWAQGLTYVAGECPPGAPFVSDVLQGYWDLRDRFNTLSQHFYHETKALAARGSRVLLDDSLDAMTLSFKEIGSYVKLAVSYITKLPGFAGFDSRDQMNLLRWQQLPLIPLLATLTQYRPDSRSFRYYYQLLSEHIVPELVFRKELLELADKIQHLCLHEVEAALFLNLCIYATDWHFAYPNSSPPRDVRLIELERHRTVYCLFRFLRDERKLSQPVPRMVELFALLPESRRIGALATEVMKSLTIPDSVSAKWDTER